MSRITIYLDNSTYLDLKQWRGGVDAAEAIKAMIYVSRHDPDFRGQISRRLHHPSTASEAAMSRITIDLDNSTDLDLKQWLDQANATGAIRAMIYVTLHNPDMGSRVMRRLHLNEMDLDATRGTRISDPVGPPEPPSDVSPGIGGIGGPFG